MGDLTERYGLCHRCRESGRLFFVLDRDLNEYDWLCRGCELASSRTWLAAKIVEIDRQQRDIFATQAGRRHERTSIAPSWNVATMVLVVEDDVDIAGAVCEILEDAGHLTTHARDGLEGLERLRELSPTPAL